MDWPSPGVELEPRYGCLASEEEEGEESLKPEAAFFPAFPLPSGNADECFRFSAPEPEPRPLGYAETDWRKEEGGVRGAGEGEKEEEDETKHQ